jgi:hypothetical protein
MNRVNLATKLSMATVLAMCLHLSASATPFQWGERAASIEGPWCLTFSWDEAPPGVVGISITQIGPFIRLEQQHERARGLVFHSMAGWRFRSECDPVYLGAVSDDLLFMEGTMQCTNGYKIKGVWEAYREECVAAPSSPYDATPLEP